LLRRREVDARPLRVGHHFQQHHRRRIVIADDGAVKAAL
jgi:hypothetical protein